MIRKIVGTALITILIFSSFIQTGEASVTESNQDNQTVEQQDKKFSIKSYLQKWQIGWSNGQFTVGQTPNEKENFQKEQQDNGKDKQTETNEQLEDEEKQIEKENNHSLNEFEQEVFHLTNVEREKQGLAPFQIDEALSKVAREKSRDMAQNGYFDHQSPTHGSPFDMMRAYGITYQTAGENIAKGQQTPEEVVNAWMNSQGHRENILNSRFTHIGIGYIEQGNHWTQQFIAK